MKLALLVLAITVLPALVLGLVRKTKARLQNRIGAPIWQPLLDLIKLVKKCETVSDTSSWLFRFAAAVNFAIALFLAIVMPWISPSPYSGPCDLFLVLYLLAASRLFTLLAALDTASPFGAFASSREATLSFLVEPAAMLSLVALAIVTESSDLQKIFLTTSGEHGVLWLVAGSAWLLASFVELSRMPIDDPTTHLELTMVHEALVLEASGKNLALIEYTHSLKMTILWGLTAQCFLHAIPRTAIHSNVGMAISSIALIAVIAVAVGTFESVSVKLNWRKAPEFIAYALSLSFIASMLAIGAGAV